MTTSIFSNRGFVKPQPPPPVTPDRQALLRSWEAIEQADIAAQRQALGMGAVEPTPAFMTATTDTPAQALAKAIDFANTKKYYDINALNFLRNNAPADQLQSLIKNWINRVVGWEIDPTNPASPYYGYTPDVSVVRNTSVTGVGTIRVGANFTTGNITEKSGPDTITVTRKDAPLRYVLTSPVGGIVPGKTVFLPTINRALTFLGGTPFNIYNFYSIGETPNKPGIRTGIIETRLGGESISLYSREWNKLVRQTISEMGLGNYSLAAITSTPNYITTGLKLGPSSIYLGDKFEPVYPDLTGGLIFQPQTAAETALFGPSPGYARNKGNLNYALIWPEQFDDGQRNAASKNVIEQVMGAIPVYLPYGIAIAGVFVIGAAIASLIGTGAIATVISDKATEAALGIIMPKPFIPEQVASGPQLASLSFDAAVPEAPPPPMPPDLTAGSSDAGATVSGQLPESLPMMIGLVLVVVILIKLMR